MAWQAQLPWATVGAAAWDPETCWFNEGLSQPSEGITAHFQMEKLRLGQRGLALSGNPGWPPHSLFSLPESGQRLMGTQNPFPPPDTSVWLQVFLLPGSPRALRS